MSLRVFYYSHLFVIDHTAFPSMSPEGSYHRSTCAPYTTIAATISFMTIYVILFVTYALNPLTSTAKSRMYSRNYGLSTSLLDSSCIMPLLCILTDMEISFLNQLPIDETTTLPGCNQFRFKCRLFAGMCGCGARVSLVISFFRYWYRLQTSSWKKAD